ncbi:MAG: DinB family protein [Dehalococcoidia bacterium]|nr:MAG: DinB family protein [Dehalococcoidia bacterium]
MTSIAAQTWPYVMRSIDRLVAVAFDELDAAGRAWRPAAEGANNVLTIVNHMISNAEDNLLGTIAGLPVQYDRQADFETPSTDPAGVKARWARVNATFEAALPGLDDARMLETVQHPRRGPVSRLDTLVVVARHAAEHLAHAELTRDLYRAHVAKSGATR